MGVLLFEVYNLIYLLGFIISYRWIRLHYKIFTTSSLVTHQKWYSDLPIQIIGLLLGIFLPFITGLMISYLFGSLIVLFIQSPKKPNNGKSILLKKIPKLAIIWFWIGLVIGYIFIIFLISLFIIGITGRWFSLDYYYPVSLTLGIIITPISYIWIQKDQKIHNNIEIIKLSKNKIKIAGIFISIIISMSFIITTSAQTPPKVPEDITSYHTARIVTFNILNKNSNKFEEANYWDNRKIHLANHIAAMDPDVFGVQEAYIEQLEYLNTTLANRVYNWSGKGRDDGFRAGEFSAIYYDTTKYQLIDQGTFWLSDTPDVLSRFPQDHYRICSWIHLQLITDNSEFFVFNTHYGFSTELQIKSSILINERVVNITGDLPVIVIGDFNMMNVYPFYMYMEGYGPKPLYEAYRLAHGYVNPLDATSAPTFKIKTDVGFHIDQIFISSGIIPKSVETVKESYDGIHTYSDHYPVKMDCYIPSLNL